MDETIAILKDSKKIEQLILKLKAKGENSPEFQQFKNCLDSFGLNKPPFWVNQKNILQTAFSFCDSKECFDSFRLVCKSWRHAVETIRLDTSPRISGFFPDIKQYLQKNGTYPIYFSKYLRIFRKLFYVYQGQSVTKWNPIPKMYLDNMKNVTDFLLIGLDLPLDFTEFLNEFFLKQNSTLSKIHIMIDRPFINFPIVALPNLDTCSLEMFDWCYQVEQFDNFIKKFITPSCINLKTFKLTSLNFDKAPQILKYLIKHHANHFVYAPQISVLEHIPLKISFLNLQNLKFYRYASHIEYLILYIPFQHNYDQILKFFPNVKQISFYHKQKVTNLNHYDFDALAPALRLIWERIFSLFHSKNIKILSKTEYENHKSQIAKTMHSWKLEF